MDWRVEKKVDGFGWLFAFGFVGLVIGLIYAYTVESPSEWVLLLLFSLLPGVLVVVAGVTMGLFVLVLVCMLLSWLWAKLTHLFRLLWRLTS